MTRLRLPVACAFLLVATLALAGDWTQFRGPHGLGESPETGLPVEWSATKNVAWRADLPGPGSSSPICVGERVFVTCYSGYGVTQGEGSQEKLLRHLLCYDAKSGKLNWQQEFQPTLPEHNYQGEGAYQGYAGSTPATDGERLYVFFGRSGVYGFDLDGKQLWHKGVGDGISGWGSGCSPIVFNNLLIVNASVESGSLLALDKLTGEEVWRAKGISASWNTPLIHKQPDGKTALYVSVQDQLFAFDPATGEKLWNAEGVHRYVCPSVVAHQDVVYAIGGGHTSLAVKTGGTGDVTKTHTLWRSNKGSNVGSPIYHKGHIYWFGDEGGFVCCQKADTGEVVYQQRLEPRPGRFWSSPVLADGKLYAVSQHTGTYVVAAKPEFQMLAHNVFADDEGRTNASPAISNGQIVLRTDRRLYCLREASELKP